MNWKALVKTVAIASAAGGVNELAKVLSASGVEFADTLTPILAVVGAYLLRRPWETKPN